MTEPDLHPRRGAHRTPRPPLARAVGPVIGALVIIGIVVALMQILGGGDDPGTASTGGAAASPPANPVPPPPAQPSVESAPAAPIAPAGPQPTAEVPARDRFEVIVLNQTRRAGLAGMVAETLRGDGWTVTSTGNFGGTVPETTVYFPEGGEDAATELSARLPVTARVRPVFPAIDAERLTVILTDNFP